MDQFVVSARKYRPDTFDSVVGQGHITGTLKNAIKSNHLAQAFLFSGPRGVGKTTCARILAKTVNCFNRSESIEACNNCESCDTFNEGHSLNIYELDAASNNGVDDIRALIDQVRFAPQIGTKKVYIIDEVHMLSSAAFNAFLKTLEEPPSHAMFILATTEKHKIIPTVLSRCQIFDFNRIDNKDMVRRLDGIAAKENVTAEHDALHLIAQKSDGSLRDALSMFDQMVTFSGNELSYASVVENLSILGTDYFFDTTDHLVSNDIASSLKLFDGVLQKGFDGHNFILGLAEHMRNLLVAQDHRTLDLLNVGPLVKEKYADQTLRVSAPFLIKCLNLLSKADLNYKAAKNQRLLVEICLINLANLSTGGASAPAASNAIPTHELESKKKLAEQKSPSVSTTIKTEQDSPSSKDETVSNEDNSNQEEVVNISEKSIPKEPVVASPSLKSVEEKQDHQKIEQEVQKVIQSKEIAPKPSKEAQDVNKEEGLKETVDQVSSIDPPETKKGNLETAKSQPRNLNDEILSDSISISAFTVSEVKESEGDEEAEHIVRFSEAVDSEKLSSSWKKLLEEYKNQRKMNLFATLSRYEPNVVDENHIVITYDNNAQAEAISKEKMNILEILRQDLKNDLLQLKLSISDNPHQRAYTDSEKLEKMIEKNPNINLLRDKLDLDLS